MLKKWKKFLRFFLLTSDSWLPYLLLGSFIIGWWTLAFQPTSLSHQVSFIHHSPSLTLKTSLLLKELSILERDDLQRALAGDFPLMLKLMNQWEEDAQLLTYKGFKEIQSLPKKTFLQAHILTHLIQNFSPDHLRKLNYQLNAKWIQDDKGHSLCLENTFHRFLPQTFAAASFLLAIAKPHEIIALPKGMRYLPQLYSPDLLKQIPANIDRIYSEKLYIARPDLAFVAPYSHPSILEVLRNQKIQLYTIKYFDTVADIQEALLKIGHASHHILEAQLLAIFMEACLIAIDNRLQALQAQTLIEETNPPHCLLYLYYHQHFMIPTSKCLSGQLMNRALKYCPHLTSLIPQSEEDWRIPFEQEKILKLQPHYLLISIPDLAHAQSIPYNHQALHELKAFKSQRIFYVDETIQDSPTQYIALAYFDLFQALAATYYL